MPGEVEVTRMRASRSVSVTDQLPPSTQTPQRRTPSASQRSRICESWSRPSSLPVTMAALSVGESGAPGTKDATIPASSATTPPAASPPSSICSRAKPCHRRSRSVPSSMARRLLRRALEAPEMGLQLAHSVEPALVVGAAVAHVLGDLGVGEDQEALLLDGLNDLVRDLLGLDDGGDLAQLVEVQAVGDHGRVDELRAQAGDPDAAVAVGDVQPLGDRDRCVLGGGVAEGADLGDQA